jgi:hypothetical protein
MLLAADSYIAEGLATTADGSGICIRQQCSQSFTAQKQLPPVASSFFCNDINPSPQQGTCSIQTRAASSVPIMGTQLQISHALTVVGRVGVCRIPIAAGSERAQDVCSSSMSMMTQQHKVVNSNTDK